MSGAESTMADLAVLVGVWDVEAQFPGAPLFTGGRSVFELDLAGTVLIQRTEVPHPDAPDSMVVMSPGAATGEYVQHYFDSRGTVRIYEMTFADGVWRLLRNKPDFSPLHFHQRFDATVSEDGDVVRGAWEHSDDGEVWTHDFDLIYRRTTQ